MPGKLRASGLLFATVFFLGYVINMVVNLTSGAPVLHVFVSSYQLTLFLSATLFLVSALVDVLRWIQPALFLLSSPLAIVPDTRSIYGLGFFIMGVLLLERAGFFHRHRLSKVVVLFLYLMGIEISGAIYSKESLIRAVYPIFFILAFLLFLWFLYKDRLLVFMKEPKARLSLSERGLSEAERNYVLEVAAGKQQKEIAIDAKLAESTVRNTLARAYKKLGVDGKAGLAALAEKFELVD